MGWLARWEYDSTPPLSHAGVPMRLLRHLVSACELRFGSRVLEVAADSSGFAPVLIELGIDTVAASPTDGRRADGTPGLDDDGRGFDLVLAHAEHSFFANLRASHTLAATAEWAARVKPGGAFALLASRDADGRPAGHALSCYRSLLARFPGTVECEEIPAGTVWQRLRGDVTGPGWFATILRVPEDAAHGETIAWPDIHSSESPPDRACCSRAASWSAERGRAAA
ncbi:MAG: hypothetical protein WD066_03830 [Planctomycetaceae bacterium]